MSSVKELEWKEGRLNNLKAEGVFGRSYIIRTSDTDDFRLFSDDNFDAEEFTTLEAAQSAAQYDYETRILSTLETEGEQPRIPKGWKLVPLDPADSGSTMGDAYLAGYEDGLEEARAPSPTTEIPEINDAMVERAARAMVTAWCYAPEGTPDWNANWRANQTQYRKQARSALEASLRELLQQEGK